ncbi:MAG: NADH-dependent [FeFe] hydrogenase, group A6 [Bacilli bacterium]|nr:NADH-dependent [FeFe] hydrogenase, group A6 [Bacilli bacterium]
MVNIKINDVPLQVEEGLTVLQACRQLNIDIPTLCYVPMHLANEKNNNASCRVCVVEIKGRRNLAPSCSTLCTEGMEVYTNSQRVIMARRTVIELMLSDHPQDCPTCDKNMHCKLQNIAYRMGITDLPYKGEMSKKDEYSSNRYAIRRNPAKCILCGACVTVCNKVQRIGVLHQFNRGFKTEVGPAFSLGLDDTDCTYCGQCVNVCPTGAITQSSVVNDVWREIGDKSKHVVVQVAPAVRAALGEEFHYHIGTSVAEKIPAALRRMGFEHVFDTNFGADLTIVEEANELVERLKEGKNLPLITSCCPGWINLIEKRFPELLHLPSSCKSPHEMFGAIAKSYFAKMKGYDPKDVVVVSIMPCTAKKDEMNREQLMNFGLKDVDYVLTTREFARMIKETGINFDDLPVEKFDDPMGESTGGADIFGNSGGVMEAAIRTAKYWLDGKCEDLEIKAIRGLEGIKVGEVKLGGKVLRACVASGLGNAQKVLEQIKSGEEHYDVIEIMACPGGCVNGGGQPIQPKKLSNTLVKARQQALYNEDRRKLRRISAENKSIIKLYDEYLEEFGSHKAHELLHTTFASRKR